MKLSAAFVLSVVYLVLPASALDCSAKRDFKLLDIYSSVEQVSAVAVLVSFFWCTVLQLCADLIFVLHATRYSG
jgi:hypothetical protein